MFCLRLRGTVLALCWSGVALLLLLFVFGCFTRLRCTCWLFCYVVCLGVLCCCVWLLAVVVCLC